MKTPHMSWLCLALLMTSVGVAVGGNEAIWECIDLNDTIPFGQSSVCSLAELPDGRVVGGCGGSAAHLFLFDPQARSVRILKTWDRPGSVRNLVVLGERFWMVVGGEPATMVPDQAQVEDEHLFGGSLAGDQVVLTDCGTPIAGEGIACLAADAEGKSLFGVTRPTPVLFRYDVAAGKFEELGKLGTRESLEYALTWKAPTERVSMVPRALVVAPTGEVYGAFNGVLFRWTPAQPDAAAQKPAALTVLQELAVPAASDRTSSWVAGKEGTCVECLLWTADGRLFAGTYDGYLFRADPAGGRMVNLGKPFRQSRIRALAETEKGELVGLCGEPEGLCRLFSYSDQDGYREIIGPGFTGFPNDELGACVLGRDGSIYVGGAGRMTALYVRRARPAAAEGGAQK